MKALSDPHLTSALHSIHEEPEKAWTLEELAHRAGMSRARFAAHFLAIVGQTPFRISIPLADRRRTVSCSRKGKPLKMVAPSVGFSSAGALIRSFTQHVGIPPMTWLADQSDAEMLGKTMTIRLREDKVLHA